MKKTLRDYPRVATRIQPCAVGIAEVIHQDCGTEEALAIAARLRLPVDVGTSAALRICGDVFMSDFEYERKSCLELAHHARGRVLIAGLGLGMVLPPILEDTDVESVTVVEKVSDVITLIEPFYQHPKLSVIAGDIFTWRPASTFETIYFDIWPLITQMNLVQMEYLHRAFKPFLASRGWMSSWMRRELLQKTRGEARADADPYRDAMGGCFHDTGVKPDTARTLLGILSRMRRVSLRKAHEVATSKRMHESIGTDVLPDAEVAA